MERILAEAKFDAPPGFLNSRSLKCRSNKPLHKPSKITPKKNLKMVSPFHKYSETLIPRGYLPKFVFKLNATPERRSSSILTTHPRISSAAASVRFPLG